MSLEKFTKEVAQLIESQFPAIYREEGEELVAFIKAYYEFLESDELYSYKLGRQMFDIADVDLSLEQFLKNFKETYLADFPFQTATDKRFLIKRITDYYRSKGTKQSLELLMKLLYAEDVNVYYPGDDVLRASDSTWYKPYYLEVTLSSRTREYLNKEITGLKSGAKAFVESIVRKRVAGKVFDVLYISDLRGNFQTNERIADDGSFLNAPKIKGSLTTVDVVLGGRNNALGDLFDVVTEQGVQGKVKVSEITNATGKVDFAIVDGGWGFTNDARTDVYIAEATIFANNANRDFLQYEKVYQPIEKIKIISGTNLLATPNLVGRNLIGRTTGGLTVGNGTIVAVTSTGANGVISSTPTANGDITILVNDGSFANQKILTLNSNTINYNVKDLITEESKYLITYSNLSGTFQIGEQVEQSIFTTFGTTVTGITGTITNNNTTVVVSSTANLIPGQPLTKSGGTALIATGTTIKRIVNATTLVLDRNPGNNGGDIVMTAGTFSMRTGYAFGTVTGNASSVLTLEPAWGTFSTTSNTVITGLTSNASALPTAVQIASGFEGAIGQVTAISGNTITVEVNFGSFDNGKRIRGNLSKAIYTINSSTDGGATTVILESNTSANGVLVQANVSHVQGILVGQNSTSIGLHGNTSPFFFANTYTSFVTTRRTELVSPPRYANGSIIELRPTIDRIAGGSGADFEIGTIQDIESNITVYTDVIGDYNIAGVPYTQIRLDAVGAGSGFVSALPIISGGTAYANNSRISFLGGGFANGAPNAFANAFIRTNSQGRITSITVDQNGSGYFTTPTVVLPATTGDLANVSIIMSFGYGFPKNPRAELPNPIGDCLSVSTMNVGSIGLLSRVNPGINYTADPFVKVRNRYIKALQRRDLLIDISNLTGGQFLVGEELIQNVGGVITDKGIVRSLDISESSGTIQVKRNLVNISFTSGYPIIGKLSGATATIVGVRSDETKPGIGDNAVIEAKTLSASGVATKLEVVNSGFGYIDDELVQLESVDGSNQFVISGTTKLKHQGISEGFWRTTTSHLNSEKKLHDNKYYQEYSYDILSGLSLNKYESVLKQIFHVAGTQMFGSVVKTSTIDTTVDYTSSTIGKLNTQTEYLVTETGTNVITKTGLYLTIRTEVQI
jgi:hypothetical protein